MSSNNDLTRLNIGLGMPPKIRSSSYSQRLEALEKDVGLQITAEYRKDIHQHMKDMESLTVADANMMDLQPELEWRMRPQLLDFLIERHLAARLQPHTLFLAINLIDRYCSKRVVFRKHYQLVGCTALWIAAKYEDKKSRIPSITELRDMCDGAYAEDMFVQMEGHVLNTLDWTIGHPTVESFLNMYLDSDMSSSVLHVARYLCEISLFHRSFLCFEPSIIANCAHILALHILGYYTTLPSSSLGNQEDMQCLNLLVQHLQNPSKILQAKYSKSSFSQATHIVSGFVARQKQQQHMQQSAAINLPPTPPPLLGHSAHSFTPPSLSSSTAGSSPFSQADSPIMSLNNNNKSNLNISVPKPPFMSYGNGYITPPCTPADIIPVGTSQAFPPEFNITNNNRILPNIRAPQPQAVSMERFRSSV